MDFYELKKQADNYRKNNLLSEAENLYFKLLSESEEKCNEWIYWGYLYSLRKQDKLNKSYEYCQKKIDIIIKFDLLKDSYGWILYSKFIKKNENLDIIIKYSNEIIKYCKQTKNINPFTLTIFYICDILKKNNKKKEILKWINLLNKDFLSTESFIMKNGKENQSQLEKYYSLKIKSLYENKLYYECIELCEETYKNVKKLHFNNQIWLKYRIANCYKQLKKYEKSIDLFEQILINKKEWFIYYDLSQTYFLSENSKKGFFYLLKALCSQGKKEAKVNLFYYTAEKFLNINNKLSEKCYLLTYTIRKNNNWNISDDLDSIFKTKLNKTKVDASKLYFEIVNIAKKMINIDRKIYKGKIIKILNNSGFIKSNDSNETFYFNFRNFIKKNFSPEINDNIEFNIEESFDKKKQKKTFVAVNIKKI